MIFFERANTTRHSKPNMPVVPSNIWDRVYPYVAKLCKPLLPNTNDQYISLNYLLAQNDSWHHNNDELTSLCDTIFHAATTDDKRTSCGFNLFKTIELDTYRTINNSYTAKPRESYLCSSVANKLTAYKSSFLHALSDPREGFSIGLFSENINLSDMIMLSNIMLPSSLPKSYAVGPMVPPTASAVAKETVHVNCVDQNKTSKRNFNVDSPLSKEISIVTMSAPQSINVCTISSRQKGKRVATMENMNNQLIHRKSQKMNKHTKRRRRRQKKQKPVVATTRQCLKGRDPTSERSIPLYLCSDTDDDDSSSSSDHVPDITISIQCLQSPSPEKVPSSSISLFFEQVIDSGTDEEWDYEEASATDVLVDDFDFPFLTTGLSSIHISGTASLSMDCKTSMPNTSDTLCHISLIEIELSSELKEVNDMWQKTMSNVPSIEKTPDKVSFATEENLITEYPVEVYNRKGEWEIYATERFRFKRRIKEVESVLAPVLTPAHRQKVLEQQKNNKQQS